MANRAIALLRELEAAVKRHAAPLPGGRDADPKWQGMGFQLGDFRLVVPLSVIAEVVLPPRITPVPWVRDWMLGIANVRGRLIPVVDLAIFFGISGTTQTSRRRALVVEEGELVVALLVDQLLGMQYLGARAAVTVPLDRLGRLGAFVLRAFGQEDSHEYELDLGLLLRSERFLNVADGLLQGESIEFTGMQDHEQV